MPGPAGIFVGLTQVELDALRVVALDRIANGSFTSLSGAGKSSGLEYQLSPTDMLREIRYAEQMARGGRPQKVQNRLFPCG